MVASDDEDLEAMNKALKVCQEQVKQHGEKINDHENSINHIREDVRVHEGWIKAAEDSITAIESKMQKVGKVVGKDRKQIKMHDDRLDKLEASKRSGAMDHRIARIEKDMRDKQDGDRVIKEIVRNLPRRIKALEDGAIAVNTQAVKSFIVKEVTKQVAEARNEEKVESKNDEEDPPRPSNPFEKGYHLVKQWFIGSWTSMKKRKSSTGSDNDGSLKDNDEKLRRRSKRHRLMPSSSAVGIDVEKAVKDHANGEEGIDHPKERCSSAVNSVENEDDGVAIEVERREAPEDPPNEEEGDDEKERSSTGNTVEDEDEQIHPNPAPIPKDGTKSAPTVEDEDEQIHSNPASIPKDGTKSAPTVEDEDEMIHSNPSLIPEDGTNGVLTVEDEDEQIHSNPAPIPKDGTKSAPTVEDEDQMIPANPPLISEDGTNGALTCKKWGFSKLLKHVHTPSGHEDRKGSSYNVLVLWENGEETYEPLNILAKDAPVPLALYAKEKELLNSPGWKRLKRYLDDADDPVSNADRIIEANSTTIETDDDIGGAIEGFVGGHVTDSEETSSSRSNSGSGMSEVSSPADRPKRNRIRKGDLVRRLDQNENSNPTSNDLIVDLTSEGDEGPPNIAFRDGRLVRYSNRLLQQQQDQRGSESDH